MSAMKACHLLSILFVFQFTHGLILPVQISTESRKCGQQGVFKNIQCIYDGTNVVYAKAKFGTADNPSVRHTVNMALDTGSTRTWLVTADTELINRKDNSIVSWEGIFEVPALHYTPDAKDRLNRVFNGSYTDGDSLLLSAYTNHRLEFGSAIEVPMDLLFAEQYRTGFRNMTTEGLLALAVSRKTADKFICIPSFLRCCRNCSVSDLNNLFLYKFLQAYPDKYEPMISFDINWIYGIQQDSCFALGESLPIKENLKNEPTFTLLASIENTWTIEFFYLELEFFDGRHIILRPNTPDSSSGQTVYLDAEGRHSFDASLDSGTTDILLSEEYLDQMDKKDKKMFMEHHNHFPCKQYRKYLPHIIIGLTVGTQKMVIPKSKLYMRYVDEPTICQSLLGQLENDDDDLSLGLPFFASTYIEMRWPDTRKINVSNWDTEFDFQAGNVTITAKKMRKFRFAAK